MIATEPPAAAKLPSLDRRSLFRTGLLGAGLVGLPIGAMAQTGTGFMHGVASGEPGARQVLLWARYLGTGDTDLRWEVSDGVQFTNIVTGGSANASPARDWCVKTVATGLEPGRWYFYRFIAPDGTMSATGRTRTLPEGPTDRFRMAVFACSNLGFGYFNAYAHAAEQNAFDLIVHTGDYFYEYGRGTYPSGDEMQPGRDIYPGGEIVQLADYRLRHATYRSDPDLQRLTQLYPMILVPDDHETANDSWRGGAENHQPESEGNWTDRTVAALRAYREWLPVSDENWAAYEVGNLATLFRMETRLTARSEQFDLQKILAGKATAAEMVGALDSFRDGEYRDASRTMIGADQQGWLAEGMRQSRQAGKPWQVLVQQVLMGKLASPNNLLDGIADKAPDYLKGRLKAAALASKAGLPLNMDAWDGYPVARERLLTAALEADAGLLVLAGDTHNAWAFDLAQSGQRVGVELGVQGVTSPGFESYLSMVKPADLGRALVSRNDELQWADTSQRGYMAVKLTPDIATSEWRFLAGIRQRSTQLAGTHRMKVQSGAKRLTPA